MAHHLGLCRTEQLRRWVGRPWWPIPCAWRLDAMIREKLMPNVVGPAPHARGCALRQTSISRAVSTLV